MDHSNHTPLSAAELTESNLVGAPIYGLDDSKVGSVSHLHDSGSTGKISLGYQPHESWNINAYWTTLYTGSMAALQAPGSLPARCFRRVPQTHFSEVLDSLLRRLGRHRRPLKTLFTSPLLI